MTYERGKPSWSLLREGERYRSSAHTDIRELFARVKAQQEADNKRTGQAVRMLPRRVG